MKYATILKVVFVISGVICLFIGFKDLYYQSQTPGDYNSMLEAEYEEGMVIEGYLYSNLGVFEEDYTTKNSLKSVSSRSQYVIPVGELQYMGLLNDTSAMQSLLDEQAEATYAYMTGKSTIMPEQVYFKGRLVEMSGKTMKNMQNHMLELDIGFTKNEFDAYIFPYYIQCERYDDWYLWLIPGFLFVILGGGMIVMPIINSKKKEEVDVA